MTHPFIKNIKSLLYYISAWIIISIGHFKVLYVFINLDFWYSLTDAVIFNSVFGIIGFALWFPVRLNHPRKTKLINFYLSYITSAALFIFVWIAISETFLALIFGSKYNNFNYESIPWRVISGIAFYFITVLVYYLLIYYKDLQEKIISEMKLKEMVKESELNLLKAQINPHFLFNSLNSISSLTITNPEKAQEMIVKLSDFLRYSVSLNDNQFSTLEDEFKNIERYLQIEQIRFSNKLKYDYEVDNKCLQFEIPVMILQPLYENAVKHGVYESTEQITIFTKCILETEIMKIIISNNFDSSVKSRKGAGFGLKNIKERLKLIYKNDSLLKTNINENIFEVILIIPIKQSSL